MIETPVFIKVPAVYMLKLPGGEWLNLALIRRIQTDDDNCTVAIAWENGDTQVYHRAKAFAIVAALEEAPVIDKSQILEVRNA